MSPKFEGGVSRIALEKSQQRFREDYDGSQPLDFPPYEALAQHLSTPRSLRQFKTDTAFANHFQASRMTVYRWKHDPDVIQRALWLSASARLVGQVAVRVEWSTIVQKALAQAKAGNLNAMKFCESIAWANYSQPEQLAFFENLFDLVEKDESPEGGE